MDQDKRLHRKVPLQMRLSMRSQCPYISGQLEQRIAVDVSLDPKAHDALARVGFRRVENWVYRPACPYCNACTAWRVDTVAFMPSKSMARILKINQSLSRVVTGLNVDEAHYDLFKAYIMGRHRNGQMAMMSRDDFINMIINSPIDTALVNYYDPDNRLVATVLTDFQSDGLSAVYSFFDPALSRRSLGTFIILDLLQMAKKMMLPWLYLGYYVEGSAKMAYKARYTPAEIFQNGSWRAFVSKRGKI